MQGGFAVCICIQASNIYVHVVPFKLNIQCTILMCHIFSRYYCYLHLTLLLLNTACPVLANSVDPNHLASEEAK